MHFFLIYFTFFKKNTPKAVALLLCMVANQQFRLKLLKQKQLINPALFTSSKLLALFVVGKGECWREDKSSLKQLQQDPMPQLSMFQVL